MTADERNIIDELVKRPTSSFAVRHSERVGPRPASARARCYASKQLLREVYDVVNFSANFLAEDIGARRKITNCT